MLPFDLTCLKIHLRMSFSDLYLFRKLKIQFSVCILAIHMYHFYAIMNFIQFIFIVPDATFIKTKQNPYLRNLCHVTRVSFSLILWSHIAPPEEYDY